MKVLNKKAVFVLALVVVILAGYILIYNIQKGNIHFALRKGSVTDSSENGREDFAAPVLNQFQIDGKHYILLSDELKTEFELPASVNEIDIGSKITDITISPDKSLIGCEVYNYIPAGCEAVVAVKKDNKYKLFRFFTFESYNNNQDEDAVEYLKLYGIEKADDIAKVQFIRHSEQSKLKGITDVAGEITDGNEIAWFYSLYSVLKNSSDKYFNRLFNVSGTDTGNKNIEIDALAPDKPKPQDDISNMAEPDFTGYAKDLPLDITSDQVNIAKEPSLTIADSIKSGLIPSGGDTPISDDVSAAFRPSGGGIMDMGDGGGSFVPGTQGSVGDALANSITIRIYNNRGLFYDSVYYVNIGFISRYEINEEFTDFIGRYLDK